MIPCLATLLKEGGRRDGEETRAACARYGVDTEAVGLDGERLLDAELIARIRERKVELLQERHERELHLLPGERTALA